jgi:hypothetical protein
MHQRREHFRASELAERFVGGGDLELGRFACECRAPCLLDRRRLGAERVFARAFRRRQHEQHTATSGELLARPFRGGARQRCGSFRHIEDDRRCLVSQGSWIRDDLHATRDRLRGDWLQ